MRGTCAAAPLVDVYHGSSTTASYRVYHVQRGRVHHRWHPGVPGDSAAASRLRPHPIRRRAHPARSDHSRPLSVSPQMQAPALATPPKAGSGRASMVAAPPRAAAVRTPSAGEHIRPGQTSRPLPLPLPTQVPAPPLRSNATHIALCGRSGPTSTSRCAGAWRSGVHVRRDIAVRRPTLAIDNMLIKAPSRLRPPPPNHIQPAQ